MDTEEKLALVTRNTEEVVTKDELRTILDSVSKPRAYWGFESSGLMHLGLVLSAVERLKT